MKKIILYISIIILAGVQYSCKKDLNALPSNFKVDGNVITDAKSAKLALNGVYLNFAEVGESAAQISTQYYYDNEVYPSLAVGAIAYMFDDLPAVTRTQSVETGWEVNEVWQSNYKTINAANGFMKGIEALASGNISEAEKKSMLGQAYFLRAFATFKLLWNYGQFWDISSPLGIILRTEPTTTENIAKPRASVKDCYDQIIKDVDFAIANAPTTNEKHYATTWAARALKARVLMQRGSAGDYATAITLADEVINQGPYQLEPNAHDIFLTKGLGSEEVIFGIKPFPTQVSRISEYYYSYFEMPLYTATPLAVDIFGSDPRIDWVFGDLGGFGELGINKYTELDGSNTPFGQFAEVNYVFRLSEMHMIKAEALVRSGGSTSTAKTIVKNIMSKAGVTDFSAIDNATTPDQLLLEIFKENFRNFLLEDGIDWLSLLRLPLNTVKSLRPDITDLTRYIMPIPREEFLRNYAVTEQNPGYGK